MNDFRKQAGYIIGAVMAVAISGAAGAQEQTARELERFTFMFPVESVAQYHPFYIAKELGFFAEEGLNVQFQDAGGSSAAIQQIIAGNADAALPSPGAFLNAVAQGHDLRWVYSYQYGNIFTLATPADSGISAISDLKGKKVGVSELSGGEVPLVRAVLRDAGLEEGTDVQFVPVGEGSALTVQALQNGQVDAYSSNLFDIAAIETRGIDMNVILPQEAQGFPSNGIVVTADKLEEDREDIAGFVRAVAKAVAWSTANDDAAFEIAKRAAPEEFEDEEVARASWEVARTLKTPPQALADAPLGTHYVEGFQAYHDFLRQGSEEEGALPADVDLSTALDTSLIEGANDFDVEAVRQITPQGPQ
jgi:NitT/TauT family transport system substrate-binding protein